MFPMMEPMILYWGRDSSIGESDSNHRRHRYLHSFVLGQYCLCIIQILAFQALTVNPTETDEQTAESSRYY
jgi:hypothetical protein